MTVIADVPVTEQPVTEPIPAPAEPVTESPPAEVVTTTPSSESRDKIATTAESSNAEESNRLRSWHDDIKEQRERVRAAQEKEDEAAEIHKMAKKKTETEIADLLEMIDENGQPSLPFTSLPAKDQESLKKIAAVAPIPADDDSWRAVTLEQLGIRKPKLVELLGENELTTLGALADYTNSGKFIKDIKGIGKAAVQTVDDAMERYWSAHPREKAPEKPTKTDDSARLESQSESTPVVAVTELGLDRADIESAFNPDFLSTFKQKGRPDPIVDLLGLIDKENRFPEADYVVANRVGEDSYRLLPVYESAAYDEVMKSYGDKPMPGEFAGRILKTKANPAKDLYLGPDDRAVILNCGPTIYTPAQLGMNPGDIESRAIVLAMAPYSGNGPPKAIPDLVIIDETPHVVIAAEEIGESVYALRPLGPTTDGGPVDGDPFANRQVFWDGKTMEVGPIETAVLVRDGGAAK